MYYACESCFKKYRTCYHKGKSNSLLSQSLVQPYNASLISTYAIDHNLIILILKYTVVLMKFSSPKLKTPKYEGQSLLNYCI